MRLVLFFVVATALMFSAPCVRAASADGGFAGPITGAQATTVEKAKTLNDKSPVVLTGNLVSRVAGTTDKYMFKDATGDVMVSIAGDVFGPQHVTPQSKVQLSGNVGIKLGEPMEVDVVLLEVQK